MAERPRVIREVLTRLVELEERLGRPHAVVLDEARHAFPADAPSTPAFFPPGLVLVSNMPGQLQREVLNGMETMLAVGDDASEMLEAVTDTIEGKMPGPT